MPGGIIGRLCFKKQFKKTLKGCFMLEKLIFIFLEEENLVVCAFA